MPASLVEDLGDIHYFITVCQSSAELHSSETLLVASIWIVYEESHELYSMLATLRRTARAFISIPYC